MKMEPNRTIEQEFKQKLEQRTIQPTEMAWDRLDAMLSVAEGKTKRPNRIWMYMAASFLALLLVGALFLSQNDQGKTNNINNNGSSVVTTTQPVKQQETAHDNVVIPVAITEPEAVAIVSTPAAATPHSKQVKHNGIAVKITETVQVITNNEAVAVNNEVVTAPAKVMPARVKVDANELLASVDKPGISSPKIRQSAVKVDANSLLSSVEGEINESFRDKVLETVSKNYNVVKSSLASRNHQ